MIGPLVLGGVVGVDRTAFGQTLLAHPLVAACLAGWWAGDVAAGIWVGLVVTLISMPARPVGLVRLRDWSSAAVVAGWLAATAGSEAGAGLALLWAAPTALAGALLISLVRSLAARWLGGPAPEDLGRRHLGLAGAHLVRGALVVSLMVVLGRGVLSLSRPADLTLALEWGWRTAPLLGLGPALRSTAEGVPRRWVVVGCALALVAAWTLGGRA